MVFGHFHSIVICRLPYFLCRTEVIAKNRNKFSFLFFPGMRIAVITANGNAASTASKLIEISIILLGESLTEEIRCEW